MSLGQTHELLEGRTHQALRIALSDLALLVGDVLGKQAGPVEVQVGIQVLGAEALTWAAKCCGMWA